MNLNQLNIETMNFDLVHFCKDPLEDLHSIPTSKQFTTDKPRGLWVSAEKESYMGWKDWCENEEFRLDRLSIAYNIRLQDKANVLHVKNREELDEFFNEYGTIEENFFSQIHWKEVTKDFNGIIIAPHQTVSPRDHSWYRSWDCAGGCIWNVNIIKDIQKVS